MRRLARVFGIDVETCSECGGRLRVIACIEQRRLIDSILAHMAHLVRHETTASFAGFAARCRAPPQPESLLPLR